MRDITLPAALSLAFSACAGSPPDVSVARLGEVGGFHYWLQGVAPDGQVDYPDLVVADPSIDGSDEGRLSGETLSRFGSAMLLAYVSIGEAESYRGYWQESWDISPPSWLGPENPDWEGNMKVRYWQPAWRRIVLDAVAAACEQGFDGVYADVIDAYWFWSEEQGDLDLRAAASRMLDLLAWIAQEGQQSCGDGFLLVPQNSDFLGSDAEDDARYFDLASAIGVEDVFFYPSGGQWMDAPWNPDAARIDRLATFEIPVLSVEYLSDPTARAQHDAEASAEGFVPGQFCRALDRGPEEPLLPCPEG